MCMNIKNTKIKKECRLNRKRNLLRGRKEFKKRKKIRSKGKVNLRGGCEEMRPPCQTEIDCSQWTSGVDMTLLVGHALLNTGG